MSVITYEGFSLNAVTSTATEVLKGGALGAGLGVATIWATNKLPVISGLNPLVKAGIQLAVIVGASAFAKDKLGEQMATAMGIGGSALVIGTAIGNFLNKEGLPKAGYGSAVMPVVDEYGMLDVEVEPADEEYAAGYGSAIMPVVEDYAGYGEAAEDGLYVEVE